MGQASSMDEVCDLSRICDPSTALCGGYHRTGNALFLQVDLSIGNLARRMAIDPDKYAAARYSRLAVRMEECNLNFRDLPFDYPIPTFL